MTVDLLAITGDARGEVRRFCWLMQDEVPRLDALTRKLHSLNSDITGRIQRPDLLSTLLLSGLDRAETTAQTLVVYRRLGVRYVYYVKLVDAARVKRLALSHWPSSAQRPTLGYVHGALIRLALQAAETDEGWRRKLALRLRPAPELELT